MKIIQKKGNWSHPTAYVGMVIFILGMLTIITPLYNVGLLCFLIALIILSRREFTSIDYEQETVSFSISFLFMPLDSGKVTVHKDDFNLVKIERVRHVGGFKSRFGATSVSHDEIEYKISLYADDKKIFDLISSSDYRMLRSTAANIVKSWNKKLEDPIAQKLKRNAQALKA